MKRLSLLFAPVLLTACQTTTVYEPDLDALLENPLFAERYSENIVDVMVNLEIYQDPLLEDESKAALVDKTKEKWLKVAKKSRTDQRTGAKGGFIPMDEYASGEVLYIPNKLYFAPEFQSSPGISVHVFYTSVVDPRDVDFPDETSVDLGPLKNPYSVQSYDVPEMEDPRQLRTVVLWDTKLDRLYGFAQMNPIFE